MGFLDYLRRKSPAAMGDTRALSPDEILAKYKKMQEGEGEQRPELIVQMAGLLQRIGHQEDAQTVWLQAAKAYVKKERWSLARQCLSRAKSQTQEPSVHHLLVALEVALGAGEISNAVSSVRRLHSLIDPGDHRVIKALIRIVETYGADDTSVDVAVADLLVAKGRRQAALARIEEAIRVGRMTGAKVRSLEARASRLRAEIESKPDNTASISVTSEGELEAGRPSNEPGNVVSNDLDRAIELARETLNGRARVTDPETLVDLGEAFLEMGLYEPALTEFVRVSEDPRWGGEALAGMIQCQLGLNDPKRALELGDRHLEESSVPSVSVLRALAAANDRVGRELEADRLRAQAQELIEE